MASSPILLLRCGSVLRLERLFLCLAQESFVDLHPDAFRTPLTPKGQEMIAYYGGGVRKVNKPPEWYEKQITLAFSEMYRVLGKNGIAAVMFAHKTTSAWETIIAGLIRSGLL